jgi:hypothetical protein
MVVVVFDLRCRNKWHLEPTELVKLESSHTDRNRTMVERKDIGNRGKESCELGEEEETLEALRLAMHRWVAEDTFEWVANTGGTDLPVRGAWCL